MMPAGFIRFITLLSTDCFSSLLFPDVFAENIEKLKRTARKCAKSILREAKDFWQDARRDEKAWFSFFDELKKAGIDEILLQRVFLHKKVLDEDVLWKSAVFAVQDVSRLLRCLSTEAMTISIGDELIEAVIDIQDPAFSTDSYMKMGDDFGLRKEWKSSCSRSAWDKHINMLMSEVPENICDIFSDIFESQITLKYLWYWKHNISQDKFMLLLNAIEKEATAEARAKNPEVADVIQELLKPFRYSGPA
jgi:hypothetical protein